MYVLYVPLGMLGGLREKSDYSLQPSPYDAFRKGTHGLQEMSFGGGLAVVHQPSFTICLGVSSHSIHPLRP